ncbi:peroxisomal biogenesis factor 19 [Polypterus senegalus]|uniref:peroxisomal biogenesis factor 19 n=1 Tax=Polypterus senegalus TaxID=55291 RepID=UPI001966297F|nr:peroxisomal biogenesis factor 19 [Polypterus senegalus]
MAANTQDQDNELEELLDSALDDFEKAKPSSNMPSPAGTSDVSTGASGSSEKCPTLLEDQQFFEALFEGEFANQAREEFDRAMKELAQEEPQLVEQFKKLSEAAGKVGSDASSQQEFTSCLRDTLSGLAKNADELQSSGIVGDDLVRALEGLRLSEGSEDGGEDTNILPIMQTIMQNLLSKEVLYPSLKEIKEKYPEWLNTHKDLLSPADFKRYEQQHILMGEICRHFENEGEHSFENILELIQQLQDLGKPPKELAGENSPGLNFDLDGLNLPGPSGDGEQCTIM